MKTDTGNHHSPSAMKGRHRVESFLAAVKDSTTSQIHHIFVAGEGEEIATDLAQDIQRTLSIALRGIAESGHSQHQRALGAKLATRIDRAQRS